MTVRRMLFAKSQCPNFLYNHRLQIVIPIRLFSYYNSRLYPTETFSKSLKILEIASAKGNFNSKNRQTHLRLIQDFLRSDSDQSGAKNVSNGSTSSSFHLSKDSPTVLDQKHWDVQIRSERFQFDASDISNIVSSCSFQRDIRKGIQYHCLALRTGFLANVYVGSSLISLYGKCLELKNAYQVFEEMPVRNIVSWTSIIAGFAQEWQIEMCLELFKLMRMNSLKPNEFTFGTILSSCTGCGALGVGRSLHCQTIKMGFDSHIHISNALISMYCKCGALNFAKYIFDSMEFKDTVSWNSMITGYAQHGFSLEAIELFKSMKKQNQIEPDGITFLGVLSSCRHAGLVEEGKFYFNLMVEIGLKPEIDHYSCVIDLLGRAGLLKEAEKFIEKMPIFPNSVIWGSLLSACKLHGNVEIGLMAAESRLLLQPNCAFTHLQLANLYARVGYLDDSAKFRKIVKQKGLKITPGYSWIEIQNRVYRFKAEDKSNPKMVEIVNLMDVMVTDMRSIGCAFELGDEVEVELD